MDTIEKYHEYVNTSMVKAVEPVVIERAEGSTYYDEVGNSYLDCFSGISVTNVGHGNKVVIEAAKAQMNKLIHCCSYIYYVTPVADLAEKIALITPGKLKKSFFANSGAEAVEGAIRLAKRYTNKNEMIALTHSFHGRTMTALSVTGNSTRKRGGAPYLPGVFFAPSPYCFRCAFKMDDPGKCGLLCAEYLEEVIRFHTSDNVAFLIAEPVMGEGGIIVPPQKYFQALKKILDEHRILFIADEVQSGFGRTGSIFAIEHYSIEPDIMVMAKGIAGGFPLSCFIAGDEIAGAFKPGDHLSTFGGNPISCAASLANINFIEESNLLKEVKQKGENLKSALMMIKPKRVKIGEVRGKGLMVGVELVKDEREKEPAVEEAESIRTALRENGVMIGVGGSYGNVLRIQPPLTITEEEIERFIFIFKNIMEN
jgi:4-aminobutyrate aminotransferase